MSHAQANVQIEILKGIKDDTGILPKMLSDIKSDTKALPEMSAALSDMRSLLKKIAEK